MGTSSYTAIPPPCPLGNALPQGATWCAMEGYGICSGPGRVYFGTPYGNTFAQSRYLTAGESIDCNTATFGCDPNVELNKECYIVGPPCPLDNGFCSDKSNGNYETPYGYSPNYYIQCYNHIPNCISCPANSIFVKLEEEDDDIDDNLGKCQYLSTESD